MKHIKALKPLPLLLVLLLPPLSLFLLAPAELARPKEVRNNLGLKIDHDGAICLDDSIEDVGMNTDEEEEEKENEKEKEEEKEEEKKEKENEEEKEEKKDEKKEKENEDKEREEVRNEKRKREDEEPEEGSIEWINTQQELLKRKRREYMAKVAGVMRNSLKGFSMEEKQGILDLIAKAEQLVEKPKKKRKVEEQK